MWGCSYMQDAAILDAVIRGKDVVVCYSTEKAAKAAIRRYRRLLGKLAELVDIDWPDRPKAGRPRW